VRSLVRYVVDGHFKFVLHADAPVGTFLSVIIAVFLVPYDRDAEAFKDTRYRQRCFEVAFVVPGRGIVAPFLEVVWEGDIRTWLERSVDVKCASIYFSLDISVLRVFPTTLIFRRHDFRRLPWLRAVKRPS
jgi:hypothetical protein